MNYERTQMSRDIVNPIIEGENNWEYLIGSAGVASNGNEAATLAQTNELSIFTGFFRRLAP